MARKKSRVFTDVELEFMHVVWKLGEGTARRHSKRS